MVEVPRDDAVKFALSVLAAFDGRPSHVGRRVSVQPLLAEHRQEGGEEGSGKTCEEDGLDMDHRGGGPVHCGRVGTFVSEGGVVDLVNEDAEEGGGLVTRVGLELGVDSMMNAEVTAENRPACTP
jgi:hypothetical protein